MESLSVLETKVEQLSQTIVTTDSENWDVKNKAILQITVLFMAYENSPELQDQFTPNLMRILKEPVKLLITDLRSQQVRDICVLLTTLARVAGDRIKPLMRDVFANILDGIKVPNKVLSGYVDDCIITMIKNAVFKSAIPQLLQEVKDNKAKAVRERCLEYLNEIMICPKWELTDRELDLICEAIKIGLQDASLKARDYARIAYFNLYYKCPVKTEKIKAELPKSLQARLSAAEKNESITEEHPPSPVSLTGSFSKPRDSPVDSNSSSPPPLKKSPSKILTEEERAALSIQASMRGMMNRRRSIVKNPFADLTASSDPSSQPGSTVNSPNKGRQSSPVKRAVSPAKLQSPPKTASSSNITAVTRTASKVQPQGVRSSQLAKEGSRYKSPEKKSSAGSLTVQTDFKPKKQTNFSSSTNSVTSVTSVNSISSNSSTNNDTSGRDPSTPSKPITLNMRVQVLGLKLSTAPTGTVRFVGPTTFAAGMWIGVELDQPVGKNNGSVQGHYYFNCSMNYGIFVKEEYVTPLLQNNSSNGSLKSGSVSFETLPPAPVFANPMLAASVPTKPPISIVAPTPAGLKMKGVASDTPVKPEAIKTQNTSSSAKSSPAKPNSTVILTSNSVSGGETVVGNAGLLKIKLSQLMGLLNQQLEIVEELEAEEKKLGEGVHVSKKIADLHNDVSQLTSQELTLIESFRQRWK